MRYLIRLCHLDYDREMALAAVTLDGAHECMLGVSPFYLDPETGDAEFALIVSDAHQRLGLGQIRVACNMALSEWLLISQTRHLSRCFRSVRLALILVEQTVKRAAADAQRPRGLDLVTLGLLQHLADMPALDLAQMPGILARASTQA